MKLILFLTFLQLNLNFIIIIDASHCQDLYSISEEDSHGVLEAKYRVDKLVRQWLEIGDTNNNDSN